jgi:hypothetical protein
VSNKPDAPAAGTDQENFASRWSRLKQEAKASPPQPPAGPAADPAAPAPELPPIDKLTIDSDYRAFFHPKVGEDVRRAALKKLFSDPRFNIMDGLDVYIDDYSKTEPIPPEMMAGLRQAQNILGWAKEDEEQRAREERARKEQLAGDAAPKEIGPPEDRPVPAAATQLDAPAASVPQEDLPVTSRS